MYLLLAWLMSLMMTDDIKMWKLIVETALIGLGSWITGNGLAVFSKAVRTSERCLGKEESACERMADGFVLSIYFNIYAHTLAAWKM